MLTERQAFKVGFIGRCLEAGLTVEQMHDRVKEAAVKLAGVSELLGDAAGGAVRWGVPLALAAPPILGGLAGYGAAQLSDIDDTDVNEIKQRETINEYEQQRERLERERQARMLRTRRPTGRNFG
jgi:hypothetical protein